MARPAAKYEESVHYGGEAVCRFYPGAHYYAVTDEKLGLKNQRMGGGTSITGLLAKGQGLMLFPMYEAKKYLKQWARTHTFEEILESSMTWEDILKQACNAYNVKSDLGKNVGTDAHAWVELYLREGLRVQQAIGMEGPEDFKDPEIRSAYAENFVLPEIADVEEIALTLRKSYIAIYKATKPVDIEGYKKLPRLIFQDAEMQEAIYIESMMLRRAIIAGKEWMEMHDIFVHGTEDTVYSRELEVCGKYDGDISVTCSKRCDWCYRNGDEKKPEEDFTGRYIEDYKSTNSSREAPKGIYSEYLIQCGVYDVAKTEEFPEIKYDGHLILNGSKHEKRDADGNLLPAFSTHFSFSRERNRNIAIALAGLRDPLREGKKEVESSA